MVPAAPKALKLPPGVSQLFFHGVSPAQQFVALFQYWPRHRDIARAVATDQNAGRVVRGAEQAGQGHDQGATFSTKTLVPGRPSESFTSTLTRWSPAGKVASGMSMPAVCT